MICGCAVSSCTPSLLGQTMPPAGSARVHEPEVGLPGLSSTNVVAAPGNRDDSSAAHAHAPPLFGSPPESVLSNTSVNVRAAALKRGQARLGVAGLGVEARKQAGLDLGAEHLAQEPRAGEPFGKFPFGAAVAQASGAHPHDRVGLDPGYQVIKMCGGFFAGDRRVGDFVALINQGGDFFAGV